MLHPNILEISDEDVDKQLSPKEVIFYTIQEPIKLGNGKIILRILHKNILTNLESVLVLELLSNVIASSYNSSPKLTKNLINDLIK